MQHELARLSLVADLERQMLSDGMMKSRDGIFMGFPEIAVDGQLRYGS